MTLWRTEHIFSPFLIGKFRKVPYSHYLSLVLQSIALLAIIMAAIGWKCAFQETYKSIRICARASRVSKKTAEEPTVSLAALLVDPRKQRQISIIIWVFKEIHSKKKKKFLFLTRPAKTELGMTFSTLPLSSLRISIVATVELGTKFLSINTRVMLVATDPLLETQKRQNHYKGRRKHTIIWCLSVTEFNLTWMWRQLNDWRLFQTVSNICYLSERRNQCLDKEISTSEKNNKKQIQVYKFSRNLISEPLIISERIPMTGLRARLRACNNVLCSMNAPSSSKNEC